MSDSQFWTLFFKEIDSGLSGMSDTDAWANQAASLVEVQRYGGSLEKEIRNLLDWDSGRVVYDADRQYKVQIDCAYPELGNPEVIVSVTYSNPDKPGHSNENKLQLKLGELALIKRAYPGIKVVLVLGGSREAWLPYVLDAFEYFFDDVIFLWLEDGANRLIQYGQNPDSIPVRHHEFWSDLTNTWNKRAQSPASRQPPCGLVRYQVLDQLVDAEGASRPEDIPYELPRACMIESRNAEGREWEHFKNGNWNRIEMSRSYFNPVEAATQLVLDHGGLKFEGGLAKDVEVRSFLRDLGLTKTRMSEDFVLYSKSLDCPVYIQCKASGGGRTQHGKNIQNRTKEQIARGILYTCVIDSSDLPQLF